MPHVLRRRRSAASSSCIRASVRATSIPPHSMNTPSSLYWRMLSSVSAVISLEWSTGKMKFEAWPVEPPGFGQRALVEQRDVGLAEPGQVVGDAVADDAGADDHHALAARQLLGTLTWP